MTERISPRPLVARVLHHVAVIALLADVVLLVVAVALGGVEGNAGRAAGTLVALVAGGDGGDGFGRRFRHRLLLASGEKRGAGRSRSPPHGQITSDLRKSCQAPK